MDYQQQRKQHWLRIFSDKRTKEMLHLGIEKSLTEGVKCGSIVFYNQHTYEVGAFSNQGSADRVDLYQILKSGELLSRIGVFEQLVLNCIFIPSRDGIRRSLAQKKEPTLEEQMLMERLAHTPPKNKKYFIQDDGGHIRAVKERLYDFDNLARAVSMPDSLYYAIQSFDFFCQAVSKIRQQNSEKSKVEKEKFVGQLLNPLYIDIIPYEHDSRFALLNLYQVEKVRLGRKVPHNQEDNDEGTLSYKKRGVIYNLLERKYSDQLEEAISSFSAFNPLVLS